MSIILVAYVIGAVLFAVAYGLWLAMEAPLEAYVGGLAVYGRGALISLLWPIVILIALGLWIGNRKAAAVLVLAAACLSCSSADPKALDYWTGYYAMRMNVDVETVSFQRSLVVCHGIVLCACSTELPDKAGYDIIYSVHPECGGTWRWSVKARAREEVCRIRMGPRADELELKGCAKWYDN